MAKQNESLHHAGVDEAQRAGFAELLTTNTVTIELKAGRHRSFAV